MNQVILENYKSVMADKPSERTSHKYRFIPSTEVVKVMESQGWIPSMIAETKSRKTIGFQKHKIEFVPNNPIVIGDTELRIILTNSHDGLSAFRFDVGLLRLACANGLVVGNPAMSYAVRHMGFQKSNVIDVVGEIVKNVPILQNKIEQFKQITMNQNQIEIFDKAALVARYGEEKTLRINNPLSLDLVRREEDKQNNLWMVYNRAQENLIKGKGYRLEVLNEFNQIERKAIRKIKSINEQNRLNKALWLLTEEMAKLTA